MFYPVHMVTFFWTFLPRLPQSRLVYCCTNRNTMENRELGLQLLHLLYLRRKRRNRWIWVDPIIIIVNRLKYTVCFLNTINSYASHNADLYPPVPFNPKVHYVTNMTSIYVLLSSFHSYIHNIIF